MASATEIKEFALDLGYSKVGITPAETFSGYIDEIKSRGKMYDYILDSPTGPVSGSKPLEIMPTAKSVIILIWDYAQRAFPKSLVDKIGRVYLSRSYSSNANPINKARLQIMKDFLMDKGFEVNSNMHLPERWAAAKAGATTFGKNNFAYAEGIGSFIIIVAIAVDKELEYDNPTMECKCPDGCMACIEACPTKAIYEPFKLNPRRCITFNTRTTQEGRGYGISTYIPYDIRENMGSHVYGCDICQEACPINHSKLKANLPGDEFLFEIAKDFSLTSMLHMQDEFYETRIQPINNSYLKERKYFQRNAAVAIGNTCDPSFIADLKIAMGNQEELVRAHAAWALGKIGGNSAKQVLASNLNVERSEKVREEIKIALTR
jgi:epoxyqueuosine reductase